MHDFTQYGNEGFILFLFPLIGLLFERLLSRRNVFWIIGISFLLLIPIFTPYTYVVPYAFRTLILIMVSASFTVFLGNLGKRNVKVICAVILTVVLFVVLGFLSFMDSFSGSRRVERSWHTGRYRIEYIVGQGFSGRPGLTYELSKYTLIPLLIRHIDTTVDSDTANSCVLYFSESELFFNKCDGTVTHKKTESNQLIKK